MLTVNYTDEMVMKSQDLATWGQQVDPNQWSAYYGYGGTYDAYGYGVVQDPSLYAYGAYSGYASYPQQVSFILLIRQELHTLLWQIVGKVIVIIYLFAAIFQLESIG